MEDIRYVFGAEANSNVWSAGHKHPQIDGLQPLRFDEQLKYQSNIIVGVTLVKGVDKRFQDKPTAKLNSRQWTDDELFSLVL